MALLYIAEVPYVTSLLTGSFLILLWP